MLSLSRLFGEDAAVLRERDFQVLLLIGILAPFGNGLLSPILNSLIDPLGASVADVGLLVSVFMVPGIVVIPAVGVLADRYGRKPILAPSLVLFGVSGAAIAVAPDFGVALVLRLLQGIGWAGLFTLIVTSIGDLYTGTKEATAQGLNMAGSGLGGGAISVAAGALVVVAWQVPFLLYLLSLPVAVAVLLWLEEPTTTADSGPEPDDRTAVDGGDGGDEIGGGAEVDGADGTPGVDGTDGIDGGYRWALLGLVRDPRVFSILVARTLPIVVFLGFLTYNSVLVVRLLSGTPAQAGLLYAVVSVVYALVASQVGRVTTRIGGRYRALVLANGLLLVGLAVAFLAPVLPVVGIGAVIVGAGFGIALPAYNSLLTGFAPGHLRAGLVSLSSTGARLLGVLTPVAMGAAIVALTPTVGFDLAVRLAGVGAAILGGGGGLVCLLVALAAGPVEAAPGEPTA